MWRDITDDVRLSLRLARRHRLTTAAVIATMVLGISTTTAVFSVVRGVLVRPLPFEDSRRVVQLGATLRSGDTTLAISLPDLEDFRRGARSFSSIAAGTTTGVALTEGDAPQQLRAAYVDDAWPGVFAARMQLGRFFAGDEFTPGGPRVVVLTDALWARVLGRDRSIVGRTLSIGGAPHEVIGVLAADAYRWPGEDTELFMPLVIRPGSYQLNRGAFWLQAAGKLLPDVSIAQARAEVASVDAGIIRAYPSEREGIAIWAAPLHDLVLGDVRGMVVLLAAAVAAVLLIVCVNVANVLLVQSAGRSREFALRAALGGSRLRLSRQVLTEGMLLALPGGMAGIALAPALTRGLVAIYPGTLPRGDEVTVDAAVVAVAALAMLLAGTLSAWPAIRRARGIAPMRGAQGGARSSLDAGQRRASTALLVAQVAVSVVLLFAAGLLVQTFQRVSSTEAGFRTTGLLTFGVNPSAARHADAAAVDAFHDRLGEALRVIPGVTSVASANEVPFSGYETRDVFVQTERGDLGPANPQVRIGIVSTDFFATLGIPVLAGRGFTGSDGATAPRVVVINEALRRRYYADADPVGRTIEYNLETWQLVGVVGSTRMRGLTQPEIPELYVPATQRSQRSRFVLLRVAVPPSSLVPQVRRVLSGIDPMIPMTDVATIESRLERDLAPQRYRASLVGSLGILALLLVTLGIYGVVAYGVSRRVREIGIRMALGERGGQVWTRVVGASVGVAGIGVLLGIGLTLALHPVLASVVVGVRSNDPLTLVGVALLLVVVAAAAAAGPARRATRVDPVTALRAD